MISIAVLAAGRGIRFGGDIPKPLVELGGRPLVAHALSAAVRSDVGPVMCVVSDDRVGAVVPDGVEVVRNDHPERGIASSLQAALRAVESRPAIDAVVVGLADQPMIGPEAYERLAAAETPLAVATYGGTRGNPVRIGRSMWPDALGLAGDEGARVLFRSHGVREVPCDGTGDPTDVDTPDQLAVLERRWRSQTASE